MGKWVPKLCLLAPMLVAGQRHFKFTPSDGKMTFPEAQVLCKETGGFVPQDNLPGILDDLKGGRYWIDNGCQPINKHGEAKEDGDCGKPMAKALCAEDITEWVKQNTCYPTNTLEDGHYKVFPDSSKNFQQANKYCREEFGDSWGLVIFNSKVEYLYIQQLLTDNCVGDLQYWTGYREYNNGNKVETIYDKVSSFWDGKWSQQLTLVIAKNESMVEPNDAVGDEECVAMNGADQFRATDESCSSKTWPNYGLKKDRNGMGFICENHNYADSCEVEDREWDTNYQVVRSSEKSYTWQEARDECTARGRLWDLAVIETQDEIDRIVNLANCVDESLWVGMRNMVGDKVVGPDGEKYTFDGTLPWDLHSNIENPEPNDNNGDEACVRIRGNLFNDAECDRTWTGSKRDGVNIGYVCEKQELCEPPTEGEPLVLDENEYRVVTSGGKASTVNWGEAKSKCKAIGKGWNLVVFNRQSELDYIMSYLTENCLNLEAYWVGYKNPENGDKYGDDLTTVWDKGMDNIYGGYLPLKWDTMNGINEPNNNMGAEECVRMKDGYFNDAMCSRTWTGPQHNNVGMGYICEKHPSYDYCSGEAATEIQTDKYKVVNDGVGVSYRDSRVACQAIGDGWDLAGIADESEQKVVMDLVGCTDTPFWLGFTEDNGIITDLMGLKVPYAPWESHFNPLKPEPNDSQGNEACVRMRGDKYNDAKCTLTNGDKKVPMGYVCEYNNRPCSGASCKLACHHNLNVLPWDTPQGCRPPTCDSKLAIVDAWKQGGKHSPVRYGFIGLIEIPESEVDNGNDFSVLIRFSSAVTKGHFQMWNMNFWNFYNGGYEVLLHSKWWNTDRHDKYSVSFVAEGLDSDEYPEVLFWTQREKKHQCFDPNMFHGQRSSSAMSYDRVLETKPHVTKESATRIRFANGQITAVSGRE